MYFDPSSIAGPTVCEQYLEDFHQQTRSQGPRLLGLDNWGPQATDAYQKNCKDKQIKPAYTPEDTTDATAVTDAGPGNEIKKRMVVLYKKDLESSRERLEKWKNGDITTSERRILFTKWAAEAWEDYSTNNQAEITAAFKRCGMFNDVDGRENHLVQVQGCSNYEVPAIGSEPEPVVDAPKKRKRKSQGKKSRKKAKH